MTSNNNSSDHSVLANFDCISSFVYKSIPVHKYRSKRTGLTVALAEVEGPLVNGFFTLATEAHDHDGCPHVLEHLVFLGSETYPFKGVLDQLANRCFAQGTNAWTDTDHTCYTITTAGSEGFLNLLPVYLDHILYPTITDTGFHTEVHHINGEGEDAGVVYCEMQARQNTGESKAYFRLLQNLYPNDSGYGYETGGLVENLRELTVQKVRDYHKSFYRPENLCVIVTGKVELAKLLESVYNFEEKIVVKPTLPPHIRPWTSEVPPITENVEETIEFPTDDDEDGGMVFISWRAHQWEDFEEGTALYLAWKYLTESAVSVLRKTFIETDDALCGDLSFSFGNFSHGSMTVEFKNVQTQNLNSVKAKFFETLDQVINQTGIDMQRMKNIITLRRVKHFNSIETDAHNTFSHVFIYDFLYGKNSDHLFGALNEVPILEKLETKDDKYWADIIQRKLLSQPHVCIIAKPSSACATLMQEAETARIQKQVELLGQDQLKKLSEDLEDASSKNDVEIPDELIEQFLIPSIKAIPFIDVLTYRSDDSAPVTEDSTRLKQHLEKDTSQEFPFFVQYSHIPSSFIQVSTYLDTSKLPDHLRPYIELYLEALFELPIMRNGELVPHEQVVTQLNSECVSFSNGCGLSGGNFVCGEFPNLLVLKLKFEEKKFHRAVQWMREFLFFTQFDAERLKISAKKLISEVANIKRNPNGVCGAMVKWEVLDHKKSNNNACNFMLQLNFLNNLVSRLERGEEGQVIAELEEFRAHITQSSNIRLHVVGDIFNQSNPKSPFVEEFLPEKLLASTKGYQQVPFECGNKVTDKQKQSLILGMASTDSSYLQLVTDCVDSYDHPDLAALAVLIEYITALEGPMWKQIRGQGLSYSYGIRQSIERGLLSFTLFKSGSLVKAFAEAKSIIDGFITKEDEFDELTLSSTRSSVIFDTISDEETYPMAAELQMMNYLRRVSPDATRKFIHKVNDVTIDDVNRVLLKYFPSLFDPQSSTLAVVTNTQKLEEITDGAKAYSRTLVEVKLNEYFNC